MFEVDYSDATANLRRHLGEIIAEKDAEIERLRLRRTDEPVCGRCGVVCSRCGPVGSRTPTRVRERHLLIQKLRDDGLLLKEIGLVVSRQFKVRPPHHSSLLHHLANRCSCERERRDGWIE